jgi:hypothetical protein
MRYTTIRVHSLVDAFAPGVLTGTLLSMGYIAVGQRWPEKR